MPAEVSKARLGKLPKKGKELWYRVYDAARLKDYNEQRSASIAWSVIKRKYKKDSKTGKWILIKTKKKTSKAKKGTKKKNPSPKIHAIEALKFARKAGELHNSDPLLSFEYFTIAKTEAEHAGNDIDSNTKRVIQALFNRQKTMLKSALGV